jgi:hypothetical protein
VERTIFPSRKTQLADPEVSTLWSKMYHYFQLNRDEFKDHYQKRSNIEATSAAIKRKFGETLKSKNPIAQVNELLAKIIAYNLTAVIHEMYENGIQLSSCTKSPKAACKVGLNQPLRAKPHHLMLEWRWRGY